MTNSYYICAFNRKGKCGVDIKVSAYNEVNAINKAKKLVTREAYIIVKIIEGE